MRNDMKGKKQQRVLIERINNLCKEKGISHYALSGKSDVPLGTLLHILDGTTKNPGIFTILKLCDGFDMTIAEFFQTEEMENLQKDVE